MSKKIPSLSPGEWEIMKAIWDGPRNEIAVREVFEQIGHERDWSYSTIRTMMDRLVDKGYLRSEKRTNVNLYRPVVPRRRALIQAIGGFIDQVFDGSAGPLVVQLLKQAKLSEEERREIRQLLKDGGNK